MPAPGETVPHSHRHREGDLIIGTANASAILTLVERTSRFNLLGNLDDGCSADAVLACLVELFDRVPSGLARLLSWDQGREMAGHAEFARMTAARNVKAVLTET